MMEKEQNSEIKYVFVTGVNKGIGKAICQRLLAENKVVYGSVRQIDKSLDDLSYAQPNNNFNAVELDLQTLVNNPKHLQGLVKSVGVDALVLNAGYGQFASLENFSYEQIQQMININLTAQLYLLKAFLPYFKQQKKGRVVIIGSENANDGGPFGAVYAASKAGLKAAVQSLRKETASNHIHLGIINPGMVRTSFFESLNFEPAEQETSAIYPEQIADSVSLMLNMPDNSVIDEINISPLKKVVKKK